MTPDTGAALLSIALDEDNRAPRRSQSALTPDLDLQRGLPRGCLQKARRIDVLTRALPVACRSSPSTVDDAVF